MSQIDQQQFKRSNDTSFMMKSDPHPLSDLVAAELAEPVDPRVSAMAAALAAHYGDASRAVLFYGSCLRMRELEGLMLDFYLIVSDYRAAYGKRWLATANRLIPPNVFPFAHRSEEHTSELLSLMRTSYAVFCLKKKNKKK